MEPLSNSILTGTIVEYLAKTFKENKSIKDFFKDFTDATVKWIRPIFLVDENIPKDIIVNLENKPDSQARQNAVRSALEIALEDNPEFSADLEQMYLAIVEKLKGEGVSPAGNTTQIGNNSSNNITIQGIQSGGDTDIRIDRKFDDSE